MDKIRITRRIKYRETGEELKEIKSSPIYKKICFEEKITIKLFNL